MQRILFLFYGFLLIASPAIAQQTAASHLQEFTTENGLPSNGIKGLQWDENTGFLWIATEAGIVRFNGVDFRSYTKQNMQAIASERMLFMTRNNAGAIYISDMSGNIFSVNQNKPVLWRKSPGNVNPYIDNYYLLAVSDLFFNSYSGNSTVPGFSSVTDKVVSLSDTSCIILRFNSLYYHSVNSENPVLMSLKDIRVNNVFKIDNNFFIVDDKKQFFLLNTITQSLTPVSVTDESGGIFKTQSGYSQLFWETGMQNPVYIDEEKAWLFTYNKKEIVARLIFTGIPSDALIKSVQYSEKNKTLFIGTDSKGLIILNRTLVETKKRAGANPKNRNSIYSQVELLNGNVLTNEGDIIGNTPPDKNPLPIIGKFSYYVSQTNDSLLWYSQVNTRLGYHCLHQYNKINGQTKVFGKLRSDYAVTISGGHYYLANQSGVGILEEDSIRYLFKYAGKNIGNITFAISEINPGILAIATCGGLLRFTIATSVLDTLFYKENICVRSIWKYKDYVFFGTYGAGYYIYKNGQLKSMPLDKNNYLLYAHCFMPDKNGYCWISTNRGLFKTNLDELINVFEKNTKTAYYHYFGKKDGMEMTELNGGCTPCALALKNNTISFPTMDGLLWVEPEKAIPVLPAGEIFIDEILIDNKITNPAVFVQQSLPAKTGEIIFRLAFSAWCNKENIYLEYQLNDTINWQPVTLGNVSEIRFNNLMPGKYVLRIRKLNGFGYNNYTYKEINFSITTPWTQRWWFYFICTLAFLGVIAFYSRFRNRQFKIRQRKLEQQVTEKTKELKEQNEILEKNNTIKTRLISIISHDIITPLKFLTVAGKNLLEKRKLMNEELQQETILEMTNTSQELQLLSTNILNWIKYQNENRRMGKELFNVQELVGQVLGLLQSMARQKKLVIVNQVEKDLEIYQFYEPLKILVYNLLTNAIHFTEKGNIIVSAIKTNDNITISVKDEGIGMLPEQIQRLLADHVIITSANVDNKRGHGLGYLIIKDLIKTMEAVLTIDSEKGKGTTVSVKLPATKNSDG